VGFYRQEEIPVEEVVVYQLAEIAVLLKNVYLLQCVVVFQNYVELREIQQTDPSVSTRTYVSVDIVILITKHASVAHLEQIAN
jgi:hypothetical protein